MVIMLAHKQHVVDNVWSFIFETQPQPTWTAGQYIRVELPHEHPDQEGTKRWFTVSAAPFEGHLQITTRVTNSTFKQALANLPIGGQLTLLEAPEGDFVWQDTDRPHVFIAAGIGITPFHSILTQRAHEHLPLETTLIYANRTKAVPFREEFDALAAADPSLQIHYVTGPLSVERVAELVPQWREALVYLSGPEPLVETLGDALKAAGIPEDQLKQDFFPNYTESNY